MDGTWFIQEFCKTLKERADGRHDFRDIMDLVSSMISLNGLSFKLNE